MRGMTSWEFTQWMGFYKRQPWGERVQDLRFGSLMALMANINRNADVRKEPFLPSEFTPWSNWPQVEAEPLLLPDKDAHSRLLSAALFGKEK